jgi:hypothetical protein
VEYRSTGGNYTIRPSKDVADFAREARRRIAALEWLAGKPRVQPTHEPQLNGLADTIAKIIDPGAWGLPAHQPSTGDDYLSDRDEARDKAIQIINLIGRVMVAGLKGAA